MHWSQRHLLFSTRSQKYFLFLEKKVSYLQLTLMTHICKSMTMRIPSLMSNIMNIKEILRFLGLTVHPDKSKFIPTQYITQHVCNFLQRSTKKRQKNIKREQNIWKIGIITCNKLPEKAPKALQMTITLTLVKIENLLNLYQEILKEDVVTIQ